jgi:triosephosphate isomerase
VGLKTLIFAGNKESLINLSKLKPDFLSYEPPELVGSATTSVAEAKPEIISEAVEIARAEGLPLVVGAGIKSTLDIKKSLELGAAGFAVASSIVKAENPKEVLKMLAEGYN